MSLVQNIEQRNHLLISQDGNDRLIRAPLQRVPVSMTINSIHKVEPLVVPAISLLQSRWMFLDLHLSISTRRS